VLYEYRQGRSGDFPKAFLAGFSGYLHVDGYAGYHKLLSGVGPTAGPGGVTLVGCWAHARRPYDEAMRAMPKGAGIKGTLTEKGLSYCNLLFKTEEGLKHLPTDERKERRSAESLPAVEEYFAWAKSAAQTASPKMKIGEAVNYSISREEKLRAFLLDGRLELSNNRSLSSSSGNPHHSRDTCCRNAARENDEDFLICSTLAHTSLPWHPRPLPIWVFRQALTH
jgi:hypothetical protein